MLKYKGIVTFFFQASSERVIFLKKALYFSLILLLLLTLVPGTSPVRANTSSNATVNVSVLNVRSGPGSQHARIAQVNLGTVLPVLSEQPGWVQVSLSGGRNGWISRDFVTIRTVPDTSYTARVTARVLNVRSGPGTTFSRITTVAMNSLLSVQQKQGDWLQVRLPSGQTGWVAGQHTAAVTTSAPATPPATNMPTTPPTATPNMPSSSEMTAVVNTGILNVRSGPGADFELLTSVARNSRLPVLQSQGDWLEVLLPSSQTGWIQGEFALLLMELADPPPQLQPSQPQQPPQRQKMATVTVGALNARSAPDTSARILALLPQGTTLPVLAEQANWLRVSLLSGQAAWIAGWFASVSTQDAPASPSNPGGNTPTDPTGSGSSPLAGKIIVVDPGHGGSNPGAVGSLTGLLEKALTLDVSLRVADRLRQGGATVVMTRYDDYAVSLAERVAIAEAARAHAFVSIHANAHPSRDISGTETYFSQNQVNSTESFYLASHLQNELLKSLERSDRGVKHANFHVIRETTMPAALVELAFISNHQEEALLGTDSFRESSAQAIVRALERFFQP